MNRFVLSSSFASLGFLPLIFQTPTAQETVVDIAVEPAVVAELVSPATQAPSAATPENEIEAVLGKLEWVLEAVPTAETAIEAAPAEGWILESVPTEERGVILDVTPVESAGGMLELRVTPTPTDDENAQLRKRVKELEARMAELMGHQENNQTGRWHAGKVEGIHGHVAPHASGQAAPTRVKLHEVHGEHRVVDSNGNLFELHGGEARVHLGHGAQDDEDHGIGIWVTGDNDQTFSAGKVRVHPGHGGQDDEDQGIGIWVTGDNDQAFSAGKVRVHPGHGGQDDKGQAISVWVTGDNDQQHHFFSDEGEFTFDDGTGTFFHCDDDDDCDDDCDSDCDDGHSKTRFITIGSGSCELGDIDLEELGIDLSDLDLDQMGFTFENVDFEELDLDLEDLGIDLENFRINVNGHDIDLEDLDLDMEDFDIDLEDIDFEALGINFEDLDIDIEELIEEGALDDHEVIVRVGIAGDGAHDHQHARQGAPHVVRKRVVRSSTPQVARLRSQLHPTRVVRSPRAPRAPRAPHNSSWHTTSSDNRAPHKAHDMQEEWTDILEEMHDELRELRGVISDLSNELRELSESKGRGTRRGSMR